MNISSITLLLKIFHITKLQGFKNGDTLCSGSIHTDPSAVSGHDRLVAGRRLYIARDASSFYWGMPQSMPTGTRHLGVGIALVPHTDGVYSYLVATLPGNLVNARVVIWAKGREIKRGKCCIFFSIFWRGRGLF